MTENLSSPREYAVDLINNLNVQIAILNAQMAEMEQTAREDEPDYEALSELEAAMCAARLKARTILRRL